MNLEFVDRTKKDGFILYFKMRPEHFEDEWELMKTRINEYF